MDEVTKAMLERDKLKGNLYAEHDAGERFVVLQDVTAMEAAQHVHWKDEGDDPYEGCDMVWECGDRRLFWDYDDEQWADM
jgi:hypothetical protein